MQYHHEVSAHRSSPRVSDERVRAAGVLFSTTARLERGLDQRLQAEAGIPHTWFEVLLRLDQAPDNILSPGDLAREMVLTTGGITRLVDRLADAGLVRRSASEEDRRRILLQITPHGAETLQAAAAVHTDHIQRHLFDILGPRKVDELVHLLRELA